MSLDACVQEDERGGEKGGGEGLGGRGEKRGKLTWRSMCSLSKRVVFPETMM